MELKSFSDRDLDRLEILIHEVETKAETCAMQMNDWPWMENLKLTVSLEQAIRTIARLESCIDDINTIVSTDGPADDSKLDMIKKRIEA